MADKVHCIRKTLRLMPQEAKVLSDKAKANGMNEAEYIRLLISQKPNDYPEVRKPETMSSAFWQTCIFTAGI